MPANAYTPRHARRYSHAADLRRQLAHPTYQGRHVDSIITRLGALTFNLDDFMEMAREAIVDNPFNRGRR